jgi:hypothetical protein
MRGKLIPFVLLVCAAASAPAAAQTDCAGAIRQLRTVVDSDVATGNLSRSVYARMQPGIAQAAQLCQAGHMAAALRTLETVKHRYGYR